MGSSSEYIRSKTVNYWQTYLVDCEPCLFPQLTDGTIVERQEGVREHVNIDAAVTGVLLADFCVLHDVAAADVLRTTWAVILGRYTGIEGACFGNVMSANNGEKSFSVCRAQLRSDDSVSKVLSRLHQSHLQSLPHALSLNEAQITAFNKHSLFNTALDFWGHEQISWEEIFTRESGIEYDSGRDIVIHVKNSGSEVEMVLEYVTSTLSKQQALNLASTFKTALLAIVENAAKPLMQLNILSDGDLETIWSWNKECPKGIEECVQQYIHRQVIARPDSIAVCASDASLTYHTLDEYSTKLAHDLVTKGVKPGVIVPLCFEKTAWMVVAMLGLIKAGGGIVFLDPYYPMARLEDVVKQVDAKLVLTSRENFDMWKEKINTYEVSQDSIDALPYHAQTPETAVSSSDVLFVIFTSGSTGHPKGCVTEHSAYLSAALQHGPTFSIDHSSRVLQFASYNFDLSILEVFTTLIFGACVCIPDELARSKGIASVMNEFKITWAFLTPSLVKLLKPDEVPLLKTLVLGGEAVSRSNVETWSEKVKLMDGYGPSECSIVAAINSSLKLNSDASNIGRAVGGNLWVVDASNYHKLVPIGAIGELAIEGPNLARGYLNNPEKTASVFVQDPAWMSAISSERKRRLYMTGDLARLCSDGSITFVGRKDTQVKVRGQRVELGEIEHHISMDSLVKHVMVTMPAAGLRKNGLVATLSFHNTKASSAAQELKLINVQKHGLSQELASIHNYVSARVPGYMIPETWIVVEALPLNSSAKIDRMKVKRWTEMMSEEDYREIGAAGTKEALYEPITEMGAQLQEVISHVLNLSLQSVVMNRSFLNLGGDSISAMQVMTQCKDKGIALKIKDILRHKTLTELALSMKPTEQSKMLRDEELDTPFELTPIQQFYFQLEPEGSVASSQHRYNQSFMLRLTRNVSAHDMAKAIDGVVQRHSMLRARFRKVEGGNPTQYTIPATQQSYRFKEHNVAGDLMIEQLIAEAQDTIDIWSGPVFSADLFNGDEGQLLFLVAHHAVIDLVSWRIIMQEIQEILENGMVPITKEKPLPYQTWARLQAEYARQNLVPKKVLPFEVPPFNMEYWGLSPNDNKIGDTRKQCFVIDAETTSRILGPESHRALRTEPIDLFLSALIHSFSKIFKDREAPTIFREGHGREPWNDEIDISSTVGWFTSIYPVHVEPAADIVETVRRMKDTQRSIPGKGWPYFASRYNHPEGASQFGNHLFSEIQFDYLGLYQQLERDGALLQHEPWVIEDVGRDVQRFSMFEVTVEVLQGQLQFTFEFNRKLKHQLGISNWIMECEESLRLAAEALALIQDVQYTLSDFPLLSIDRSGLDKLANTVLPRLGVSGLEAVEDAYSTSPMQTGLLLSQARAEGWYQYYNVFEVRSTTEFLKVDVNRFQDAWQRVVDRHSSLRTVFVDGIAENSAFDQIVLKTIVARVVHIKCERHNLKDILSTQQSIPLHDTQPPHRMTICETSTGEVFFKLDINHALIDGMSILALIRDLAVEYDGRMSPSKAPLYSDYISYLQGWHAEEGLEYWRRYLSGVEPSYFPTLNDGVVQEDRLETFQLEHQFTVAELNSLCKEMNTTLSTLFQTAWALVLQNYTGLDEVCFGYLVSGRELPIDNINDAIGAFINILVSRLDMSQSMAQLLEQVQGDYANSIPHQHCSLADIQHCLDTNLEGQPLFNSVVNVQSGAFQDGDGSISFKFLHHHDPTEYDVAWDISVAAEKPEIALIYRTSILSSGQAHNIASCFEKALMSVADAFQRNLLAMEVDLFGERDKNQIWSWNQNLPQKVMMCVHMVIEEQVKAFPESPAICSWDGEYTYTQLDEMSTKLAYHLVDIGVGPEVMVSLCFEKSAWTIVAILAVMKAGGTFALLDPSQSLERLSGLIEDLDSHHLLTSQQHSSLLAGLVDIIYVVNGSSLNELQGPGSGSSSRPCTAVKPENSLYVIFTSGTTGKPKGSLIEHAAFCTSVAAHSKKIQMLPTSRVLQYASYTFDACLQEILTTLMVGGCVCIPSDHERLEDLAGMITRTSVNWAVLTPTVSRFLVPSQVPRLKTLVMAGETMSNSDLLTWRGAVTVINGYGPSECCIITAYNDNVKDKTTNIGTAVGGVCWIVDPNNHNRLRPIGCVGELLIEGPILARKYINDEKKTAEVFITNPPWLVEGRGEGQVAHRLYKTGDLVRYNSDGTMIFLGRRDTQVKFHGQRIEVGEIEHHFLQKSPIISEVSVDMFNLAGRQGKQALVACFTCVDKASEDDMTDNNHLALPLSEHTVAGLSALKSSLADVLPSYMIPSIFILVKHLPIGASGKLDRKKLRQLAESLSAEQLNHYSLSSSVKRAPGTVLEKRLQLLWAEVLGVSADSLGVHDSFFRVGGDSIIAMRLVAAARNNGIILTVASIFNHPKLCDMASVTEIEDVYHQSQLHLGQFAILETENPVGDLLDDVSAQCGVDKRQIKDIYPCTPLQEALMALTLKQQGAYVGRSVFRLPETINVSLFRQAWERTVEMLPILRTRIVNLEAEGSLQVVLDDKITWKTAEVLDEYLYRDQQTDILYGGLLSRYGLVGSGSHWYFIWTIHHALYDGWSQSLVFEQIQREYEGQSIPALVPFNHFIKYLSTSDSKSCEDFWRSELDGEIPATFPQLPSAAYQPRANRVRLHSIHFSRNPESDILLSTIIRAAWAIVVARYTNAENIVFGTTMSGRNAPVPDIETVVGPTVTTVPIKVRFDREQTVAEFLIMIQAQATRMMPFEHWGLQNINRLNKNAQFQNLLVIQPGGAFESKLMGAEAIPTYEKTFNTYALCIECMIAGNGLELKVTYDDQILPDVQPLLHQFEHVMRQLNDSVNYTKLGDINLCSPEDEIQIWKWNNSYPEPAEEFINTIIDKWTVSNPDAPAICSWDANLSYAELDRLSTRLSQHLVSLGVGPELIVPLCFEKSAWVIVAMLAILKAGGAICLLDPSHPPKRLQDILSTVEARILLTSPFYYELSTALCGEVIVVDEQSINAIRSDDHQRISSAVKSTHAAYVVFTSGTTGKPKGSITTHSALASNGLVMGKNFQMSSSSRTLQYTSLSFDPYIIEILCTLMYGGCVCVIGEEVRTSIPDLVQAINDMNVNLALLTPSVARLIPKEEVPTLTAMILGGEGMQEDDKAWSERLTLMNAYGPSECTVSSLANTHVTVDSDCTNIGKAMGGVCWIVESHNHNALAPVGCIGELLIEGPLLSRGYINEKEKTADVFIESPTWLRTKRPASRLYKTGDLVRYNPDGSINYIGRKDLQIKFHGQRLELGEIEHHLSTHKLISSAAVLFPKSGYCKGRLVAVMSFIAFVSTKTSDYDLHLVDQVDRDVLVSHLSQVRAYLEDRLPTYMVPSVWAMVNNMPLSNSAKLNKQKIATWLENIGEKEYLEIMGLDTQPISTATITPMESRLQEVLSRVLNQDIQKIALNRSFLNLGGDSITAMHVMARCRAEGITVEIKDIMQSKNISQLAMCAKEFSSPIESSREESFDTHFDLSPIQEMYFLTNMGGTTKERAESKVGEYRFNQSSFLRLRRATELDALLKAIEALVGRHSMLRARFTQSNGRWTQRVLKQVSRTYHFQAHTFNHMKDVASIISASQSSLDPENGPVFRADVFQSPAGEQLLFLAAHHLVVDVVSWRVLLQDLEMLLCSDSLLFQKSLPFQTWCTLQADYFKSSLSQADMLPFKVTQANYDYWGFGDRLNVYGDSLEVGFTLGPEVTSKLLGDCHAALKTTPVDIFLSALIQSFNQIFPDRSIPPVFSEGHGREPWNSNIDLSGTVGWFTTVFPIQIPIDNGSDMLETLRRTKDTRSQIKDNGWSYFASRFMKKDVSNAFKDHWPMEMVFNYLGLRQELERNDGLLQQVSLQDIGGSITDSTSDVGSKVRRLGLFEVTAEVDNGVLKVHLVYNRHVRHQSKIRDWMTAYEKILVGATEKLPNMEAQHTLSDFPLLSLTYSGLEKIQREQLPKMGISSLNEVEDIYPCSPTQQGILISQSRSPQNYKVHTTFEVSSMNDESVDVLRLQNAWQKVVARHAILRTVFMNSASKEGLFDQIVLKRFNPRAFQMECGDSDIFTILNRLPSADYTQPEPPHCLTICKTERQVYMKLEISHALMDRLSMGILLQDLSFAYDGKLSLADKKPPLYSDYISYVQTQPQDEAGEYWKRYLDGVEPCHFPTLNDGDSQDVVSIQVDFSTLAPAIFSFCQKQGLTTSNLFQVAWGLVLRSYTSLEQVCFGYLTSGRDAPVEGIQEAVGVICNMMVCRLDLSKKFTLRQLLKAAQDDWMNGLQYQHTSLATIQHQMGFSGQALFNTAMSFMGESKDVSQQSPAISFGIANAHDPSEYDITLNITALDGDLDITLGYQPTLISEQQAGNVASVLTKVLQSILDTQGGYVDDLNLMSDHHHRQLLAWNNAVPKQELSESSVINIIKEQIVGRADAPAVCSWDGNFSYSELDILSTRLANYLTTLGIGPDKFVPVCMEKSKWVIVAMLAIIKAGGAFVPMDAEQTGRFDTIVQMTNATIVLTSARYFQQFSTLVETATIVDDSLMNQLFSDQAPPQLSTPNNALYVLFTSGSTGEPKGVVIENEAYCASMLGQIQAFGVSHRTRTLQFSSYSFDACMFEILTTLMVGGCICMPSDAERLDDLAGAIRKMEVNMVMLTPSVAKLLSPEEAPSLQTIIFAGESAAKESIRQWHDRANVVLAYGPTECSCVSSFVKNASIRTDPSSIGMPNMTNFWIVDASNHNKLVPVGAVGELLIEGPLLARGYLNNPTQTAAVFIENPEWSHSFSPGMTTRMYKTGDLVRYNEDGSFRYLGRKDTQVKLRGQRIELGEVEHHLRRALGNQYEVVAEVLRFGNDQKDAVLAAFICLGDDFDGNEDLAKLSILTRENLSMAVAGVESRISETAPLYMIPSVFIPVKSIPLAPSLKTDRRKLRLMAGRLSKAQLTTLSAMSSAKSATMTETEKRMQGLWASVLNIDPNTIKPSDKFYNVGGDSIIAVKLVAACRNEEPPITLSVVDILRNPSLSSICRSLGTIGVIQQIEGPVSAFDPSSKDNLLKEAAYESVGMDKANIEDIVEATAMQSFFITTGLLACRGNTNYFIFSLTGPIDSARLEESCRKLISNHPILRTVFVAHQRQLWQVILRSITLDFRHYTCKPKKLNSLAAKLAEKDQAERMSFGDPIVRFMFLDGGNQSLLLMRISHTQYDGMSVPILIEDLAALYEGKDLVKRPTFSEFVHCAQESNADGAEDYWYSLLKGSSMTNLVSHKSPPYDNTNMKTITHEVPSVDPQAFGMTFATILKAAWALVLAQLSGQKDVVFGHVISGRNMTLGIGDINKILGPCVNMIPVRVQLESPTNTVMDLLQQVHQQQLDAIPFETFGLEQIVEQCTEWPLWTRFSSIVQHQNLNGVEDRLKTFQIGKAQGEFGAIAPAYDSADIMVISWPNGNSIKVDLLFSNTLIPSDFAESIMEKLCKNIQFISENIHNPLPPITTLIPPSPQIPILAKNTKHLQWQVDMGMQSALLAEQDDSPLRTTTSSQDIVEHAWNTILSTEEDPIPNEGVGNHTCFFNVWGSLLAAAQFAEYYTKLGFEVSMEDIIENPTMYLQSMLLLDRMLGAQQRQKPFLRNNSPKKVVLEMGLRRETTQVPLNKESKLLKWVKGWLTKSPEEVNM